MIKYIHDAMAAKREQLENNDKGFTLIELLVVVLILGILAAIAIPVFIGQQNAAADSAAQSNLANAKVAAVSYLINNSALPSDAADLVDFGWPATVTDVTIVSTTGQAFCFSAVGGSNTWYVTNATNVSTTVCS